MYRLLAAILVPMLLAGADLTIDHVTVAGSSLKISEANLASVGIHCEYGGPHGDGVTEMALASFPDGTYLEAIALRPQTGTLAAAKHVWAEQMKNNSGPCAWAVRSKDLTAEITRLKAAGETVGDPEPGERSRPDGMELRWETAQVGPAPKGTFFPFLIRDVTPRKWRAFPTGKPTTKDFAGIATVVIAVRDLDGAVKRYRQAYGLEPPIRQVDTTFGAQLALLGGSPVIMAAPLNSESWLNQRLKQFGEGPCAFILSARKPGRYAAASSTQWFGADIHWLDSGKLGWRLGYE